MSFYIVFDVDNCISLGSYHTYAEALDGLWDLIAGEYFGRSLEVMEVHPPATEEVAERSFWYIWYGADDVRYEFTLDGTAHVNLEDKVLFGKDLYEVYGVNMLLDTVDIERLDGEERVLHVDRDRDDLIVLERLKVIEELEE